MLRLLDWNHRKQPIEVIYMQMLQIIPIHKVIFPQIDFKTLIESYFKKREVVPAASPSPPLPPGAKAFDNYDKMATKTFDQQRYTYPQTQVLQSGPGVLPPPQTLASLSTPGSGTTWHHGYVSRGGRTPQQQPRGYTAGRGRDNAFSTPQKSHPPQHNNRGPAPSTPILSSPIDLRPAGGSSPVPPPFSGGGAPIIVTPNTTQPRQTQKQFGQHLPTGSLMNSSDVK